MAPKYVLITGCSVGGIGSALAVAFQKRGLSVIATGRDLSKLSHLEELPDLTVLPLSPTSAASVEAAVDKVRAITGSKLDYLVNNASQTIIMADPGLRHRNRQRHIRHQCLGPWSA